MHAMSHIRALRAHPKLVSVKARKLLPHMLLCVFAGAPFRLREVPWGAFDPSPSVGWPAVAAAVVLPLPHTPCSARLDVHRSPGPRHRATDAATAAGHRECELVIQASHREDRMCRYTAWFSPASCARLLDVGNVSFPGRNAKQQRVHSGAGTASLCKLRSRSGSAVELHWPACEMWEGHTSLCAFFGVCISHQR